MNTQDKFIKISIIAIIFLFGLTHILFAESIFQDEYISVIKNAVNIHVKDKQVIRIGEGYKISEEIEIPSTITYENNTYISVKKMKEILNLKLQWNNERRTIIISEVPTLNRNNFVKSSIDDIKNNINTDELTIFYIGSPGCSACQLYAPKLNKVVEQFEDINTISYINTMDLLEEEKDFLRNEFDLKYIPVTIFTKNGIVLEKIVGDLSEEKLIEIIENLVKK